MSAPWAPGLAAACLVAVAAFGSLVSTSGLIGPIRRELGLSYGEGGFLLSAPFALIAVFAVAGGRVVDRLGPRRVLAAGALLALAGGGGRAWAEGFWGVALGTVLVGAGMGLIFPVLPKIVSGTVPEAKRGLGAALYTAAVVTGAGCGVAVTPLLAGGIPVMGGSAWRGGYLGWALLLLGALLLWGVAGARGTEGEEAHPPQAPPAAAYLPAVWGVAASLFINNVIFYTSLGWLPSLLAGKGWSSGGAGWIVSLVPWLGVAAVLLAQPAAAALGGERNLVRACALAAALALAALPAGGGWLAAAGTASLGLSTNFWFLLCLAFPARHVGEARAGAAAGLIIGLGYAGGFAGPWAAGVLRDLTGGFGPALYAMAALALAGVLTAPFFAPPRPSA